MKRLTPGTMAIFKMAIFTVTAALIVSACNLTDSATETPPAETPTDVDIPTLPPTNPPTDTFIPDEAVPPVDLTTPPPAATPGGDTPVPTSIVYPVDFDDRFVVTAPASGTIFVEYTVNLRRTGQEVFIYVRDSNSQVIGGEVVTETVSDTLEVEAPTSGTYEILVSFGGVLEGNYTVNFGVR
ncbi:MAG: hypothetical protein ACOCX3_03080 [Chloroflexota bacterium]